MTLIEGNDEEQWDWMKVYINGTQVVSWSTDTGGWCDPHHDGLLATAAIEPCGTSYAMA